MKRDHGYCGEPICANCQNPQPDWRESEGFMTCMCCGMMGDQVFDARLERRTFADSVINHTRGSVADVHLSMGNQLTNIGGNSETAKRLQRMQKRLKPAGVERKELNMEKWFQQLTRFITKFNLNNGIKDRAKSILVEFQSNQTKNLRGANKGALVVAAIFLACNQARKGRRLIDLVMLAELEEKTVRKFVKAIKRSAPRTVTAVPSSTTTPAQFISSFRADLVLPFAVERAGMVLLKSAMDYLEGKRSSTIAAACIKVGCEVLDITTKAENIAVIAQIAESTLNKVAGELKVHLPGVLSSGAIDEIKRDMARGIGV